MKRSVGRPFGKEVHCFNMKDTFESAQPLTFHADFYGKGRLVYFEGNEKFDVTHTGTVADGKIVLADSGASKIYKVKQRLRLDDDMEDIYSRINTDSFIGQAIQEYKGMRLTLNDPWETVVCFIISQFNNVKRIRMITKRLIDALGSPVYDRDGHMLGKAFPTSEQMSDAGSKVLGSIGAGFRARYLESAARFCSENMDLYGLRRKGYDSLKESLMEIDGVGDKVADCIALMGYGKLEAFPIDTWIKRMLESVYFGKERKGVDVLHAFAEERWGRLAGYAQQYLFHYSRNYKSLHDSNDIRNANIVLS